MGSSGELGTLDDHGKAGPAHEVANAELELGRRVVAGGHSRVKNALWPLKKLADW